MCVCVCVISHSVPKPVTVGRAITCRLVVPGPTVCAPPVARRHFNHRPLYRPPV